MYRVTDYVTHSEEVPPPLTGSEVEDAIKVAVAGVLGSTYATKTDLADYLTTARLFRGGNVVLGRPVATAGALDNAALSGNLLIGRGRFHAQNGRAVRMDPRAPPGRP